MNRIAHCLYPGMQFDFQLDGVRPARPSLLIYHKVLYGRLE
jgi:hypothetical protein